MWPFLSSDEGQVNVASWAFWWNVRFQFSHPAFAAAASAAEAASQRRSSSDAAARREEHTWKEQTQAAVQERAYTAETMGFAGASIAPSSFRLPDGGMYTRSNVSIAEHQFDRTSPPSQRAHPLPRTVFRLFRFFFLFFSLSLSLFAALHFVRRLVAALRVIQFLLFHSHCAFLLSWCQASPAFSRGKSSNQQECPASPNFAAFYFSPLFLSLSSSLLLLCTMFTPFFFFLPVTFLRTPTHRGSGRGCFFPCRFIRRRTALSRACKSAPASFVAD